MPRITKDTSNSELKRIAEEDVARISKTIQRDPNGREFFWNAEQNCFLSKPDENGKIWILGIDSSVAGYWHYCPKVTGANSKGYDIKCRTPHFVFVYQDGEKLTCTKCGAESTVNIVTP